MPSRFVRLLLAAFAAVLLSLCAGAAFAQSETVDLPGIGTPAGGGSNGSGSVSSTQPGNGTSAYTSPPGTVTEGLGKAAGKIQGLRSGLSAGALRLSDTVRSEADKLAFALGVITLVLAGFRFAGTGDATAAWTDLLEELTLIGIFAAIYVGYDQFGPGIFEWFNALATRINGAEVTPGASIITTAGKLWDSYVRIATSGFSLENILKSMVAAILLFLAFLACAFAAIIFYFFTMLGELQVAVGVVVGPIAVALAFSSFTRRYFTAWLDYMFSGSLYIVVAAIISRLVTTTLDSTLGSVNDAGTDTMAAGVYALAISIMLILISLEIPAIAGKLFGTGGGVSGDGALRAAGRGAWKLGGKMVK